MLEALLRVGNFYWAGDVFRPPFSPRNAAECLAGLQELQGQFALACETPERHILLARDRLGVNKLFFALHESGKVVAANYLIDLVRRGVPFEAVYSVPAGHFVELNMLRRTLRLHRYLQLKTEPERGAPSLQAVAGKIRAEIERWFSRLAKEFGSRTICLNLSGGLDSGVIAAFARRYFENVTAYTYGFGNGNTARSEDLHYAERLAEFLGIPFRMVPASSGDVLKALDNAVLYGQDWRDFNVHFAIVNEILANAIEKDARQSRDGRPCLVLTGDLMNEFLADYSPVSYRGRTYYALPNVDLVSLRLALIRGLDAGDREIGVLNHHGLDIIQPYGFLLNQYLRLPTVLISERDSKPALVKAIAGDFLPPFLFERVKVRAQIGDSEGAGGILPLLVDSGRDSEWLKRAFRELFKIEDESVLSRFILMGVYRFTSEFPGKGCVMNGYYASELLPKQGDRQHERYEPSRRGTPTG